MDTNYNIERERYLEVIGYEEDKEYDVYLDYFKQNGKFYSSGEYKTKAIWMHDLADEIKELKAKSKLPDVTGTDFIIYVNAIKHSKWISTN
ncbi:hypothetical protein [Metaclostridioides mangenotii]|uniref:hypothetical protein n=1 Tax=Metaclostridioides mangenotii TaxID=1540 RepID=UPI0004676B33|nr:hypothetical protein [Clostridioides mangenotii]